MAASAQICALVASVISQTESLPPSTVTGQKRRLPVVSLRKPVVLLVVPQMIAVLGCLSTTLP